MFLSVIFLFMPLSEPSLFIFFFWFCLFSLFNFGIVCSFLWICLYLYTPFAMALPAWPSLSLSLLPLFLSNLFQCLSACLHVCLSACSSIVSVTVCKSASVNVCLSRGIANTFVSDWIRSHYIIYTFYFCSLKDSSASWDNSGSLESFRLTGDRVTLTWLEQLKGENLVTNYLLLVSYKWHGSEKLSASWYIIIIVCVSA